MSWPGLPVTALGLTALLLLAACGGDAPPSTAAASLGTLAYVVSECRDDPQGYFLSQELRIRHGDAEATVARFPDLGPVPVFGQCEATGHGVRFGFNSVEKGVLTRLNTSVDGSRVAFEVTDAFSNLPLGPLHLLSSEQKGIFIVSADGSGLRRLGPPSRQVSFSIDQQLIFSADLAFSPDGRHLAFSDLVAEPSGAETSQIISIDLATGERFQVTHLPLTPPTLQHPAACCPFYTDDRTISFLSTANPDGVNPGAVLSSFSIDSDGSNLKIDAPLVVAPDSRVDPSFHITGDRPDGFPVRFPDQTPRNHIEGAADIVSEIVLFDASNRLQLTRFQRIDTFGGFMDAERRRVFVFASANPPELGGTNPTETCQLFSIDRNGGDLRQLTSFDEGGVSLNGCYFNRGRGCAITLINVDLLTDALVFYSSCDPFDTTGSTGGQIFAMNPDGSDLRQLTQAGGLFRDDRGMAHFEIPGPIAYGPYVP